MNSIQNRTMSRNPAFRLLSSIPIWVLTRENAGQYPQVLVEVFIGFGIYYLLGYTSEEALALDQLRQPIEVKRVRLYNRPAVGRQIAHAPAFRINLYIADAETDNTE